MGARIRKNGRIFCAALNEVEEGDCYLDDRLLYHLSVEMKILVTTENDYHMSHGGEWWWKGQEPKNVRIDNFYYSGKQVQKKGEEEKYCNAPKDFLPCNVNDNGKCKLPTHCDYQSNEQPQPEQDELQAYHLNCDTCGNPYWSINAFPKPQWCEKCVTEYFNSSEQNPTDKVTMHDLKSIDSDLENRKKAPGQFC